MVLDEVIRKIVREEMRSALREALPVERAAAPVKDEHLSVAQAAVAVGVSPELVRKWIRTGQLRKWGEGRNGRVSRVELLELRRRQADTKKVVATDADLNSRADELLGRR